MKYNKVRIVAKASKGLRIPKFLNPFGGIYLTLYPLYSEAFNWPDFLNLSHSNNENTNSNNNGSTIPKDYLDNSPYLFKKPTPLDINLLLKGPGYFLSLVDNESVQKKLKEEQKQKEIELEEQKRQKEEELKERREKFTNATEKFIEKASPIINAGINYLGTLFDNVKRSNAMSTVFSGLDGVSKTVNNPYLTTAVTALKGIDSLGGKRSKSFSVDLNVVSLAGSSYNDSMSDMNRAASRVGKYGLFSGGARHAATRDALSGIKKQNKIADITDIALTQRNMINDVNYLRYNSDINGGYDLANIRAAKSGMKILDKINLVKNRNLHSSYINVNTKSIEEFKQGGIILSEWEPVIEDILEPVIEEFKEGGSLKSEWEPVIELQEGGKTRTLEELIEYAKKENPRFILRLSEPPRGIEFIDDEGNKGVGNVYLEWGNDDKGNAIIYPRILEMDDKSLKFLSSDEAWKRANENNNILIMSPEEAQIFFAEDPEYQTAYKRGWPEMFKNYSEKAKLRETPLNISKIKNYYKDYNLDDIQFIYDESPRVEGNNLYVKTDEDAIHELWHFLSLNKPNEIYKEFYDNLNDDKIIELGGDINFVKRFENDPGHFYHPSELEARIKAAKFNSQGQEYTKDFFKNLRSDENKYGYNMRDLLHMYNDENLEKIFNLKKGGILKTQEETSEIEETTQKNVIPEGALHKNKHHMEHTEGLTQKGIPVVDNEGNLQAEIELNEWTMTLELTKTIEELYKQFYSEEVSLKEKDDLAISAGRILVEQILHNTDDRTNLIKNTEV